MELLTAIRERRSIRRYSEKDVTLEQVLALIDCARWAPTASNLQAWEFQVTLDRAKIDALRSVSPGMFRAPKAIVAIAIDKEKARRRGGAGGELLGLMDACFAAQNILLAAQEMGLGTCVVRSFHQGATARLFGNPEPVVPELLITIGYPAGPTRRTKRRPLAELVHLERWGVRAPSEVGSKFEDLGEGTPSLRGVEPSAPGKAVGEGGEGAPKEGDFGSLRSGLVQFLSFLASSARGLAWEPSDYGPFRLIDACSRLISIMDGHGLGSPGLAEARRLIEDNKLTVMDDAERFNRLIDEVLGRIIDELSGPPPRTKAGSSGLP